MRKSRAEAAETRKRIVRAASREFRSGGVAATGLADLMKGAGLTHGGFYKHFGSKDQVVAEATAEAACEMVEEVAARPSFASAVAGYLSAAHRDAPGSGCPFAALGSELARAEPKTREAASAGFEQLVNALAAKLPGPDARPRALAAAATLVGALTMSRLAADPKLSAEILRAAEQSLQDV